MKCFLLILSLLILLHYKANAQSLTLNQLIQIEKMQPLDRDAYLVKAGWQFKGTDNLGDTLYVASWVFLGPINTVISRLEAASNESDSPMILYTTMLRHPFDVIREAIVRYHMEMLYSEKDAMITRYRGAEYNVTLALETKHGQLPYWAGVQRHGYTKAFRVNEDGTTTTDWIIVPPFTPAQRKRYDAFADSVERLNQKIRAERSKPPTLKK